MNETTIKSDWELIHSVTEQVGNQGYLVRRKLAGRDSYGFLHHPNTKYIGSYDNSIPRDGWKIIPECSTSGPPCFFMAQHAAKAAIRNYLAAEKKRKEWTSKPPIPVELD